MLGEIKKKKDKFLISNCLNTIILIFLLVNSGYSQCKCSYFEKFALNGKWQSLVDGTIWRLEISPSATINPSWSCLVSSGTVYMIKDNARLVFEDSRDYKDHQLDNVYHFSSLWTSGYRYPEIPITLVFTSNTTGYLYNYNTGNKEYIVRKTRKKTFAFVSDLVHGENYNCECD
jgi:hypothetical protein